jgi:PQQ-like domain
MASKSPLSPPASFALGVVLTAGLALAAARFAPGAVAKLATWPSSSSADDAPPPPPPAPPPPDNGITSRPDLTCWMGGFPLTGPWLSEQNEDLLGLMRDPSATTASLVAIDGDSFRIAWSAPVGSTDGARQARIVAAGGRVVWARGDGKAHIHDVRTGRALHEITLDDSVKSLCPHPESPGRVLHVGAHGTRASIDLETGEVVPDTGSAACPNPSQDPRLATPADERDPMPKLPAGIQARTGFMSDAKSGVLFDGPLGVLDAVKYPGFPVPVLVGFDRESRRVRWSTPLAESSGEPPSVATFDVSNGQVVALLRRAKPKVALAAIETATGEPSWTTEVPCEGRAMRLTPSRAYVKGMVQLHVFDRKTGRRLRSIGDEFPPFCY